ncbi:GntR family transcriptional regulator [Curtobacterium sp. Leaf261]|uniref:GntR family transcriptional regulator n=1 Tax=Curtobacterium sp. Leaf261 TaxID=1736311 RepID=UPI0009E95A0F|nr:GntR family transcriptional regulator [Curtobacterium sp. Leaf261]
MEHSDAAVRTAGGATVRMAMERIEQLIVGGACSEIGRLPSERDLVQRIAVSRTTLRRALTMLAERGVVTATPQSGWFVTNAPLGEPDRTLLSFTEMAARRGVVPRTKVLAHRVREATFDEAQDLRAAPLAPVLDVERLRSFDTVPICLDRSVIVLDRSPGIDAADLADSSLYQRLEALGTRPARSSFAVEAIAADDREAALLGVAVGAPLLLGTETCFDAVGRPLLIGTTRYRAEAYRFYSTMVRH